MTKMVLFFCTDTCTSCLNKLYSINKDMVEMVFWSSKTLRRSPV